MRRLRASFGHNTEAGSVYRVVDVDAIASQWQPELRFLAAIRVPSDRTVIEQYRSAGLTNVDWIEAPGVECGDIVSAAPIQSKVTVLYRESDIHHSLQLTNRCNSNCLMCSQPPTLQDDHWMVEEALDVIRHVQHAPRVIGLSGGEPLLLGKHLRVVLDAARSYLPDTRVELLTNGRLLSDVSLKRSLFEGLTTSVTWLVPLYGHADFLHDFVVQAPGAFEETLAGLLNLQSYRQPVQLRVVLIQPVLEILPALCTFIGRNLPFVKEVALMACEPIGFALANRELCEVDLLTWKESLQQAARVLSRYRVPFLFMNAPLCALPEELRVFAHRSISDWKNVYADDCDTCERKSDCSGLFAWHDSGWAPSKFIPIRKREKAE